MRSSHLVRIERRRQRVIQALLPDEAQRGDGLQEFGDPFGRLRDIISRVGGSPPGTSAANVVTDLVTLLETDVPEMAVALRALASREPVRCRYCGEDWEPLLVPAAVKEPDSPGRYQCRDVDGCEARLARQAEAREPA